MSFQRSRPFILVLAAASILAALYFLASDRGNAPRPQSTSAETNIADSDSPNPSNRSTSAKLDPHSAEGHACSACSDTAADVVEPSTTVRADAPQVALLKSLGRYVNAETSATVERELFRSVLRASEGDRVEMEIGGVEIAGTIQLANNDGYFRKFLLQLDDDAGDMAFNFHGDGEIEAQLFLNGMADAFDFKADPDEADILIEAKKISDLYCAPKGTTYPLHRAGMPKALESVSIPALPDPEDGTVPLLESLPGSQFVIYLDFDGELVEDPRWAAGRRINAQPIANATNGSWVYAVFRRVAEDFAPFDVNVTTDLSVYNLAFPTRRVQVVITPTDDVNPGTGGVAFPGSFGSGTVCWVFNRGEYSCADTITHEVGHTLGLSHDGLETETGLPLEEYYEGHGEGETSWGPIMGAPFAGPDFAVSRFTPQGPFEVPNVTQWSIGEYTGADNQEDDLEIITTQNNGLDYRVDDYASVRLAAGLLSFEFNETSGVNDVIQGGIIERSDDEDWFLFNAGAGSVSISVETLDVMSEENDFGSGTYGSNLAPGLELYDVDGNLVADNSPVDSLSSNLNTTVPKGLYYLKIEGVGVNTPDDGFSDYASIGEYYMTGTIPPGPISVLGGDSLDRFIGDNDFTPDFPTGTLLGFAAISNSATGTFRLENGSGGMLTINGITSDSSQFVIGSLPATTVGPGQFIDFQISFIPVALGEAFANISISYTDLIGTESFNFGVGGVGSLVNGDDSYEQNDTFFRTFDLSGNAGVPLSALSGPALQADNDWYQISVPSGSNTIDVQADFDPELGAIAIKLYDATGRAVATAEPDANGATIDYLISSLSGGVYYIGVSSAVPLRQDQSRPQSFNIYDLEWDHSLTVIVPPAAEDNYEDNDNFQEPFDLSASPSIPLSAIDGLGTQLDNDWYKIQPQVGDNELEVILSFDNSSGNIDLNLYNSAFYRVASSTGTSNNETINLPIPQTGQPYYVAVVSGESVRTGNTYDLTWSSFENVVPDDAYEQNDTINEARAVFPGPNTSLSGISGLGVQRDEDWFIIRPNPASPVVIVDALFTHADGDLELSVFDASGDALGIGSTATDNEFVSVDLRGRDFLYVLVSGDNSGNTYDLSYREIIEDNYEENDASSTAYDLTGANGLLISEIDGHGINADDDFFVVDVPEGSFSIEVDAFFEHDRGDIDLELLDASGQFLTGSFSVGDTETFAFFGTFGPSGFEPLQAGLYYIRVYGFGGAEGNAYNLRVSVLEPPPTPPAAPEDNYEFNNTLPTAFDMTAAQDGLLSDINGTGTQLNNDWFGFSVPSGQGLLTVNASFIHYASGNIDIALYNPAGYLVQTAASTSDNETISFQTAGNGGNYHLRVYGAGAGVPYDLSWGILPAVPDDAYEENDAYDEATSLNAISGNILSGVQNDVDWYELALGPGEPGIAVDIVGIAGPGDSVSASFYRNGYLIDQAEDSASISFFDFGSGPATYRVRISGSNNGSMYNLAWSTFSFAASPIENDSDDPFDLSAYPNTWLLDIDTGGADFANDWYWISVPSGYTLASVEPRDVGGPEYTVELYEAQGEFFDSGLGNSEIPVLFPLDPASGGEFFVRIVSQTPGSGYDFRWNAVPVETTDSPNPALLSQADGDGDNMPDWVEYVLALDESVFGSGIVRQYAADGYMHIQFRIREDAYDLGYRVVVKESATLAFSNQEAVQVSMTEDPDEDGVQIVTYRCSLPMSEMPSCFFMLEVKEPPAP